MKKTLRVIPVAAATVSPAVATTSGHRHQTSQLAGFKAGPAGGLVASIKDMAGFLRANLGYGPKAVVKLLPATQAGDLEGQR